MDDIDSALVGELQRDAGRPTGPGPRVGIAPSTCLERVRLLRQRGVIRATPPGRPAVPWAAVQALVTVQVRR